MMTPTEMHIDALMEKIEKLEAENARLQEQLRLTQVDNNLLMTENACYREALEFIVEGRISASSIKHDYIDQAYQEIAREALGLYEPDEVYDYDGP